MTSDDYRPCVAIYPPDGRQRKGNTLHIRLMSPMTAAAMLYDGHAAYVAPDDVETTLQLWRPPLPATGGTA